MAKGTVNWINATKYTSVSPDTGGKDVFLAGDEFRFDERGGDVMANAEPAPMGGSNAAWIIPVIGFAAIAYSTSNDNAAGAAHQGGGMGGGKVNLQDFIFTKHAAWADDNAPAKEADILGIITTRVDQDFDFGEPTSEAEPTSTGGANANSIIPVLGLTSTGYDYGGGSYVSGATFGAAQARPGAQADLLDVPACASENCDGFNFIL